MGRTSKFLRGSNAKAYRLVASLIVRLLPAGIWYRAAFFIARIQIGLIRPLALLGIYPYRNDIGRWSIRKRVIMARMMDRWLKNLEVHGQPFAVPIRISGVEAVQELARKGHGVLFCATHCFLAEVALRGVVESVPADLTLITSEARLRNGCLVCGLDRILPTLYSEEDALLKARRILRRGGCVIALIDRSVGGPLGATILRLARATKSPAVLGVPELQPNGDILLEYFIQPLLDSEESIQRTLDRAQAQRDRILQITPSSSASALPPSPDRLPALSAAVDEH